MTSRVFFVLDEAGTLGPMEVITDGIDKYRGYGVKLVFAYQSLGQLKTCHPNGQDLTFLSNTTQVFFGVSDPESANYISSRLGETTIQVNSGGDSGGRTWNQSGSQPQSVGGSSSYNNNWQPQARKLLKPEEVMALSPRTAITFTPELPPLQTQLLRYYEEPSAGQPAGGIRRAASALRFLLISALICASLIIMAIALTDFFGRTM